MSELEYFLSKHLTVTAREVSTKRSYAACVFLSRANRIAFSPSQDIRVIHAIEFEFLENRNGIAINTYKI